MVGFDDGLALPRGAVAAREGFPLDFSEKKINEQADDEKTEQDHDQDVHPVHLGHLRFADVMAHVIAMDEIERYCKRASPDEASPPPTPDRVNCRRDGVGRCKPEDNCPFELSLRQFAFRSRCRGEARNGKDVEGDETNEARDRDARIFSDGKNIGDARRALVEIRIEDMRLIWPRVLLIANPAFLSL